MIPTGPMAKAFAVPVAFATDAQALTVNPTAQASAAAYADVAGSTLDTLYFKSVSYTLINADQTITYQILAGNRSDFVDAVVVQAPADILAAGTATYAVAQAPYRYYKVQIKDKVGGTHGNTGVYGLAKM